MRDYSAILACIVFLLLLIGGEMVFRSFDFETSSTHQGYSGVVIQINEPVVLREVTIEGEPMYYSAEAYLKENGASILAKYGTDAYFGEPFYTLRMDPCSVQLGTIQYPIIANDKIKAAIQIHMFQGNVMHGALTEMKTEAFTDVLQNHPDDIFLYCSLKSTGFLLSPRNETYMLFDAEGVLREPELGLTPFFDENIDYYSALFNEYTCVSYDTTIGKE